MVRRTVQTLAAGTLHGRRRRFSRGTFWKIIRKLIQRDPNDPIRVTRGHIAYRKRPNVSNESEFSSDERVVAFYLLCRRTENV